MLGQRRRRWPNIYSTLGERAVISEKAHSISRICMFYYLGSGRGIVVLSLHYK